MAVVAEDAPGSGLAPWVGASGVWVEVVGWLGDGVVADGFAGVVPGAVADAGDAGDAGDADSEAGVVCGFPPSGVGAPAPLSPVFALPAGAGVPLAGGWPELAVVGGVAVDVASLPPAEPEPVPGAGASGAMALGSGAGSAGIIGSTMTLTGAGAG